MNKNFRFYAIIWALFFVAFNLVVFLVRPVISGFTVKYDVQFWIAWAFIIVAFIGNLVCTYFAFKEENLQKVFYHLPLITISWTALVIMLIVGVILMLIPNCPSWIAAVLCIFIFALSAIAITKAAWAAEAVSQVDKKVRTQTSFIRNLTVNAESVLAHAKSSDVKAECRKVYEAVRYSDPMSNEALSDIEAKIADKMIALSEAVTVDDAGMAQEIAEEMLLLIRDRNNKCKGLK